MLIGKYNKSLIISYVGVISAVLGMYFLAHDHDLKLTMICYLIAGVCDMLDGMVDVANKLLKKVSEVRKWIV